METFVINGGRPLAGEIDVREAKNAATPVLSACLLTKYPCVIDNLPLIEDVFRLLEIMQSIGVRVEWLGERKIKIQADQIDLAGMRKDLVSKIRSSILLLGPLLVRCGNFKFPHPGGCIIGARPVGTHFDALETLGAEIKQDGSFYIFKSKKLKPAEIVLSEFSVTATQHPLMAASLIAGKPIIKVAAAGPHVQDLCLLLKKMGARINGIGTHTLQVTGVKRLKGAKHFLIPDPNEAGTFIALAAAARGKILIKNLIVEHLDIVILKFKEMGVNFEIKRREKGCVAMDNLLIKPAGVYKASRIQTMPYPGIPTDLQSPLAVLCTQADGTSLIHDTLYEGRLKYIDELNKMGANAIICDPHRAIITGPTTFYGTKITSYDLRAGASLIIAALIAKGESTISDAYQVDRGYEKIDERLRLLGAQIQRLN